MFYICNRYELGNEQEYKIQIPFYEDDDHQLFDDAMPCAFICEF